MTIHGLTAAQVKTLVRIIRKVDGMSGPGVVNKPDSITVGGPPESKRREVPKISLEFFMAKITGGTEVAGFTFVEVTPDDTLGAFVTKPNGYTSGDGLAFEDNDHDVAVNTIVLMHREPAPADANGNPQWLNGFAAPDLTTECDADEGTITAVTDVAVSGGNLVQTKKVFTINFCDRTITPDAGTTTTIIGLTSCP